MGRKLAAALEQQGFEVRTSTLHDSELAFDGPATPEVLDALEFGRLLFHTLESPAHQSVCRVICSVGRRTLTA